MNIKKILCLALSTCSLATLLAAPVKADDTIKVFVNNEEVSFADQTPVNIDWRVMVPIRAVFEKAGASVNWDEDSKTATITADGNTIQMQLGQPYFYKNGKALSFDVPSQVVNDRIVIPVRAIAEAMDYKVTWDNVHSNVYISTTEKGYRACAQYEKGFRAISDCGILLTYAFTNLKLDLNKDGNQETINFTPKSDTTPAYFEVDGTDYSALLPDSIGGIKAIGFVDIDQEDDYTEIVAVDRNDVSEAYFLRYNGIDLSNIKANNSTNGAIKFVNTMFFDGVEDVISDLDGICFTNLMICPGIYSLENGRLSRYSLNTSNAANLNLTVEYEDSMAYSMKYTDSYQQGQYVNGNIDADSTVYSNAMPNNSFKIISVYFDDKDPAKFEIYVQFPNGRKAVFWPFQV